MIRGAGAELLSGLNTSLDGTLTFRRGASNVQVTARTDQGRNVAGRVWC